MAEYLEKTAVIKAIHNEIYSGGKWSGGWYEKSEEQAEKDFIKRINAITPEKVIDMSVIEKIHDAVDDMECEDLTFYDGVNKLGNAEYVCRDEVHEIIDNAVKEIKYE